MAIRERAPERERGAVPSLHSRAPLRHRVAVLGRIAAFRSWPISIKHLAPLPPFARCTRSELRRMVRHGELVEVEAGTELFAQDRADYWFYVVLSGRLTLSRDGRAERTLVRGDHVGEVAIVGFGLQAYTATAEERSLLFVLGRRQLLTFACTVPSLQRYLFPDSVARGFEPVRRELIERGRVQWERVARARRPATLPAIPSALRAIPGRPASRSSLAFALAPPAPDSSSAAVASRRVLGLRARLGLIAAALVSATLGALVYHPPYAVARPGPPVDVVADISVKGHAVSAPVGRYLLLSVRFDRHNVVGTLVGKLAGEQLVRVRPEPEEQDRERAAFRDSELLAVRAAAASAGVDPKRLTVEFRDRGLTGPSAGLIYALALTDMLDGQDLARGRVIAATGGIDETGRVWPVGFVPVKARGAKAARARVLLVPEGQERFARGSRGVKTLQDALRVLRATASSPPASSAAPRPAA